MRRCVIGIWMLILLLGLGCVACWGTNRILDPISRELEAAAELVIAGNWEAAEKRTLQAREKWETWWTFVAALNSHGPMEDADNWFDRLEVFARTRDARSYGEGCVRIAGLIRAIGEGQTPALRNLL